MKDIAQNNSVLDRAVLFWGPSSQEEQMQPENVTTLFKGLEKIQTIRSLKWNFKMKFIKYALLTKRNSRDFIFIFFLIAYNF